MKPEIVRKTFTACCINTCTECKCGVTKLFAENYEKISQLWFSNACLTCVWYSVTGELLLAFITRHKHRMFCH